MLEKILGYVYEKYGTMPEYLWEKFPHTLHFGITIQKNGMVWA